MRIRGATIAAGLVVVATTACSPSLQQPSDQPPGAGDTEQRVPAPGNASMQQSPSQAGNNSSQPGSKVCTLADVKVSGAPGTEPSIKTTKCAAPAKVLAKSLGAGSGPAVKKGDSVQVNYVAQGVTSGKKASSWPSGKPKTINVGAGQVPKGWDDALVGMKAGGRKLVVLPPKQGAADPKASALGITGNEPVALVIGLAKIS